MNSTTYSRLQSLSPSRYRTPRPSTKKRLAATLLCTLACLGATMEHAHSAGISSRADVISTSRDINSRIELFFGVPLSHYHQTAINADSWKLGAPMLNAFNKAIEIAASPDGQFRLHIVYIGTNNVLYHAYQHAPGGDSWSSESVLGTMANKAKRIALVANDNGCLEAFYIGTDDVLYHNYQLPDGNGVCQSPDASGTWSGEGLLISPSNKGKELVATRNPSDGRLEVFYIGTDDVLYHTYQLYPHSGPWSGEVLLGARTDKAKRLAVSGNQDDRLEVFYTGMDDVLYHTWQTCPGSGPWSGQTLLGSPSNKGKAIAAALNSKDQLEAFYIGTDDVLYHTRQTAPNVGPWTGEMLLGAATDKAKRLALATNQNKHLMVFSTGLDDIIRHSYHQVDESWTKRTTLVGSP